MADILYVGRSPLAEAAAALLRERGHVCAIVGARDAPPRVRQPNCGATVITWSFGRAGPAIAEAAQCRGIPIGGAVAATFYLEPFSTLDIAIFASLQNSAPGPVATLAPIYDYLTARGCTVDGPYLNLGGWLVQFLLSYDPLTEEALSQALATEVEGVKTWVLPAEHLVAIALQTGRAKDHLRILEFIETGILDPEKLNSILARHGLLKKWTAFRRKYLEVSRE